MVDAAFGSQPRRFSPFSAPLRLWGNDWRLNPVQFRIRTGDPVGVLRYHNQPLSTTLFNNHCEQAEARLTRRLVFIPIAFDSPAPMKHRQIRPQETNGDLKRRDHRFFETARKQPSVIQFRIRPPVQPIASDVHEVHIFGHGLRELMPIVLRPSRGEYLRNIVDCSFIGLILGMNGALGDQKWHEDETGCNQHVETALHGQTSLMVNEF
jgi:hypothetical protein